MLFGSSLKAVAQLPTECPTLFRRNNGNGQVALCASIGSTPVAANVASTPFANWLTTNNVDPITKTGEINFRWAGTITDLPVITRVWIGTSASLTVVGPPPVPTYSNGFTFASYCFYVGNLPNSGTMSLEFTNPATGLPYAICTYQLGNNTPTTTPPLDCAPGIQTQPTNVVQCGNSTATFSVLSSNGGTYQWQYNNGGTWTNVSGTDFTGATNNTLSVANPVSYSGRKFRVLVTNTVCSGTATSNEVTLTATALPTATFAAPTAVCGVGTRNFQVNFTGTGPWSFTYTATPEGGSATPVTISNIATSTYFLTVSPAVATTYAITSVSDQNCLNSAPTGNTTAIVATPPTVSLTNATACLGGSSFNLAYTALSAGTDKYSVTTGIRAMAGFSVITNATITASPLSITIPITGVPVGTYDFYLTLSNSAASCVSAPIPFTVTVYENPVLTASASATSSCPAANVTLSAAPGNLASYSWTANPAATIAAVANPTVTPSVNTTYTVTGTDSRGCSGTASVSVTMLPAPTLSFTPSSPTICAGGATLLTASGGNTYSWSPATGLSATSGSTVIANPTSTTTYTVTSASETGCAATGQVTVTVNNPNITVAPSATTVCSGGTGVTLTASGGSNYTWTPATGLSATTGATVTASPTTTTTYHVTGTNNGCSGIASATVTVASAPINAATSTQNNVVICASAIQNFALTVNLTSATGISSMTWSYSTTGTTYTPFTTAVTGVGATLTPSSTGPTNATLDISNYTQNGYAGPTFFRLNIVGSTCTYSYDIKISDVRSNQTPAAPTSPKTTICSGENTTLTVGSVFGLTVMRWESATSAAPTIWTAISGATTNSYTTTISNTTMLYRVVYNTNTGNCGATTPALTITASPTTITNTIAPPANVCTDGVSTFTITGGAVTGASYQWQSSTDNVTFNNIIGATSQDYTLQGNLVPVTTYFRRVVAVGACAPSNSNSIALLAPIGNNQISTSPARYCSSFSSVAIAANTPTGGTGTYTYQWQSSTNGTTFNPISGATTAGYTTGANINQTTWYRRVVTSGACSNTSASIRFVVNSNPTVTIAPSSTTLCSGNSTILTASGAASYTWTAGTASLSATTGAIVTATLTTTTTYTVQGTDANGCTGTANSQITVNARPAAPTLSVSSQTLCNQASYTLSSAVSSTPSGTTAVWYTVNETAPSITYLVTSATQTGTYYAYAKDNSTSCLSTNTPLALNFVNLTAPTPLAGNISVCSPATASLLSVQPEPMSGVTYEWHTVAANPTVGSLVATPASVSSGTYYLYRKVDNCYSPTSTPVVVTINSQPTATVTATSLATCSPNFIDLTTNVNNPVVGNSYNWYTTSSPILANRVLDPTSATSGTYYLFATSTNLCVSNASAAVTATVNTTPTVSISSPGLACTGNGETISVTATNATGYQWQVSTDGGATFNSLSNGGIYSNATTAALGISSLNGLDGYLYHCVVSGAGGCSVTSLSVPLTVESTVVISSATSSFSA